MQSGKEMEEPSPQGASGCKSCGDGGPMHKEDRHGRKVGLPRLTGMHWCRPRSSRPSHFLRSYFSSLGCESRD